MKTFSLLAYTFSHFSVDFACFWILFGQFSDGLSSSETAIGFLVYNLIAFGLQMVIGYFCDKNRSFPSGAVGCLLVFTAVIISAFSGWAAVLVTALGNAFFHVGGGIDSLVNSGGKLSRSGIFVSAGALGVVFGTLSGSRIYPLPSFAVLLLTAVCAFLCFFAHKKCGAEGDCGFVGTANENFGIMLVLGLALFSVVIRSFGGTAIPMEWKNTAELGIVSAFAAFIGKFLGGFAADFFGARRTGVITLLASLPLLVFGSGNLFVSSAGIVLFNVTMPITLGICAEKLPKNPGLAFGLTTAALLIGAVPSFFTVVSGKIFLLVPAVILSAAAIFFSAENKKSSKEAAK